MHLIKSLLLIAILVTTICAREIKPAFILNSKGIVNDFVIDKSKLYAANNEGSIEIFDLYKQKLIGEIIIKPLKTTKGDFVKANIISVDRFKGKTLFVSTTTNGFKDVWLHDGVQLKQIINSKQKLTVRKAKFINEENFLIATVGHEVALFNNQDNYALYKKQLEQSTFTDIYISEDKSIMATSSESGRVTISDVKTGKILKKLDSLNVDNIFSIAYHNGVIITGGRDRRVGVYPKDDKPYYIKSDFFVYGVSLTPNGKYGIYSSGLTHDLQLFDIKTGKNIDKLIGHNAIPTTIKFINEKELFSSGYENKIFYWKLY